ncbi:AAA family ATPase [Phreatobacter sp.]|uniref:AAA family ATPase n=1 Tax=Phreatobacter sp. TaxID=1966341 RepID=UPI003F6F9FBE
MNDFTPVADLPEFDPAAPAPKPKPPESFGISFASLRHKTFPPVRWIVPDILPEGCTILASRPKLGKSWLALDAAIAVARGGFVLGDKRCPEGDALVLSLEDNERRLRSRGFKLLGHDDWPARLTVATEWPRADQGGIAKLERWAKSVADPRLIVIDVLAGFRAPVSDRANGYGTDYAAIAELRDLANRLGLAVLLIHHVRKGEATDPGDLVSGTLGLTGAADATLVLSRTAEKGATLYGRGRDLAEIDLALDWSQDACRWTIKGATAEVMRSDQRNMILAAIEENGSPMTPNDIASVTAIRGGNVRRLIGKMVRDGQLRKEGRSLYAIGNTGNAGNASDDPLEFEGESDE